VSGLGAIEAWQREQPWQDAFQPGLFGRRSPRIVKLQRNPIESVRLANNRVLILDRPIVIRGSIPKHAAMIHHRMPDTLHRIRMARAAACVGGAQVTRIEEADEGGVFVVEDDGPIPGIRTADPELWVSRLRMGLFFCSAATR